MIVSVIFGVDSSSPVFGNVLQSFGVIASILLLVYHTLYQVSTMIVVFR
jgi:hypothetical protein